MAETSEAAASAAGESDGTHTDSGPQEACGLQESAGASAKAKGKARARAVRPRIDLDDQIANANKLAEASKKILSAAKSAQKAQKRQKQRLIRKAGRLSAQDLERMAVLKRCGLYADEGEDAEAAAEAAAASALPDETPVAGPVEKKTKLAEKLSKISTSDVFFQSLAPDQMSSASSGSGSRASAGKPLQSASGASGSALELPRGKRLVRAPSNSSMQP